MKTLSTFVAIALSGTISLARAQTPTTRPVRGASAPTTAPTRSNALQDFRERLAQWRQANTGIDFSKTSHEPPTPQEWKQVAVFSKEHFPNRWKMFVKIQNRKGDDSDVVQAIKLKMVTRYRGLKAAESDMPDVYQAALDQGQLEDAAWGTLLQLKQDPQNDGLQKQLRENVQQLVNAIIQERANRLSRLQDALDQEQQSLDRQRANIDQLVDRQVQRLLGDQPFGGPGFGPGYGGGHMGRRETGVQSRDGNRQTPENMDTNKADSEKPSDPQ